MHEMHDMQEACSTISYHRILCLCAIWMKQQPLDVSKGCWIELDRDGIIFGVLAVLRQGDVVDWLCSNDSFELCLQRDFFGCC